MPRSIPVFCYHDISTNKGLAPDLFREHLDAIQNAGYQTITAVTLLDVIQGRKKAPKKSVVLTFDDCHISNFTIAIPELVKRNMTGCFFAITDFIEDESVRSNFPEIKAMPECFKDALTGDYSQFMNRGELEHAVQLGMEVHSHGCTHQPCFRSIRLRASFHSNAHWSAWALYPEQKDDFPMFQIGSAYVYNGFWPMFADGQLRFHRRTDDERKQFCQSEFSRSRDIISTINKAEKQIFCWPWGQFDKISRDELKKAGYKGSFTLERWPNIKGNDPYRINRIGVGKTKTGKWIQSRLRMYSSPVSSRVFCKIFKKQPDIHSVLYATDSVKVSGGSRQMINNAQAMVDLGLTVRAMLKSDSAIINEMPAGVEIVHHDNFKDLWGTAKKMKELVNEKGVQVIHTFHNKAYKGAVRARLLNRKFKLFINRGVIFSPNMLFGLWSAISDGMIVNSFKCGDVLRKVGVRRKKINVVPNSFIPEHNHGQISERKKRGTRVLYIGNDAKAKGFDVFLNAVKRICESGPVKDVEFVTVGCIKHKVNLDHIPEEVINRINYRGILPHNEVMDELAVADMLVIPSRLESMPNVLLEAFHYSLPVVCTNVGGLPELVRDGVNGLISPSEDVQSLSDNMRIMIDNHEMRSRMGKVNNKIVRSLLTNMTKGYNLIRVYHGEHLYKVLPIEELVKK